MPAMLPFARTALAALVLIAAPMPASAEDAGQRKLYDGFNAADFVEAGGLYYRDNAEQQAGTATFQSEVKREGAGALKLSVRPLCDGDSEGCSERAEIWEKTALRVPYDSGVWFGFSVLFVDPIPQDDHRYLIAQWKREIGPDAEGDFSPFLALRLDNGKLFATIESNYQDGTTAEMKDGLAACPTGSTPVWLRPETNQMRSLIAHDANWTAEDAKVFPSCTDKLVVTGRGNPLPAPASGWIDFAIYSRPGPDGTGHIEIFANGQWIMTAKGYIGHNDRGLGENQYFKFGPYRAAGEGEWTLYYDDFRRSPDCIDVLRDEKACALVR